MKLLVEIANKTEIKVAIHYEEDESLKVPKTAVDPVVHSPVKTRFRLQNEQGVDVATDTDTIWFDSFKIITLLGQGSFGKVFHVQHKENGAEYAMKVLKKSILVENRHLKYALSENFILRKTSHPFVVNLHYAFQTANNLYMVLDLWDSGDLMNYIDNYGELTESSAKFIM